MDILYYSNYCKHCQQLLQTLVKGNIADKISFICIDKRKVDAKTNLMNIFLENGTKVIMPPNIHSVPSLLLVKQNYRVLMGEEIIKHYHPQMKVQTNIATRGHGEPSGYVLGEISGIISEKFTSYNMSPEELSAKGKGESRQLYNYISANDDIQLINTPDDTYRPDKLSNSVTIDTLQQKRMDEIQQLVQKGPPVI
jgi:hypothetical protein